MLFNSFKKDLNRSTGPSQISRTSSIYLCHDNTWHRYTESRSEVKRLRSHPPGMSWQTKVRKVCPLPHLAPRGMGHHQTETHYVLTQKSRRAKIKGLNSGELGLVWSKYVATICTPNRCGIQLYRHAMSNETKIDPGGTVSPSKNCNSARVSFTYEDNAYT